MPVFESSPVIPVVTSLPATAPDGAMVQLDAPQIGDGPRHAVHIRFQGQWFSLATVVGTAWSTHTHFQQYATTDHTHDATGIVSGIFDVARIPGLDAAKITGGVFPLARIPTITVANGGTGATTVAAARTNLGVDAAGTPRPPTSHGHSSADLNTPVPVSKGGTGASSIPATFTIPMSAGSEELAFIDGATARLILGAAPTSHTHDGGVESRALNNLYATDAPSAFATNTVTVGRISLASRGFPTAAGLVVTEVGDATLRATQKYGASDGTTWFRSATSSTAWGDWETISYGPWTSIPPFSGITNVNAEWRLAPGNRVEMRGRFSHASATGVVILSTTLPAAARPSFDRYFAGGLAASSTNQPGGLVGRVGVLSTGTINCVLGQQTGITGVFVDGSYSL